MVDITHARPHEREEIARFMAQVFPKAKWGLDTWRALLAGRWSRPDDSFAVTVRDAGRLVGVLGLVTAERPTGGGPKVSANMSSWYVLKEYRGGGIGSHMLKVATANPEITVTNFTSAPGAVSVVRSGGFAPLDERRLIWYPQSTDGASLPVHKDPLALEKLLSPTDTQILVDHADLNLIPVAVETPDGFCFIVLAMRKKRDDRIDYEAYYISDRDVFARHARLIAESILPPAGAVLSVDSRFLPDDMRADSIEPLKIPHFYTPGRMRPEHVDFLYSEVVLLDLKL